jgi:hypothetical protein
MDKIPCLTVAAGQAFGGAAMQFIGPEVYGGDADWKSILASNGAGFAVGVLVNWLAMTKKLGLGVGSAIRGYKAPHYPIKGLVSVSGVGIAVDQGLQWLASIIVLAVMRMNTRTFLMDVAATTIGQGIGGIGAQMFIHSNPVALSTAVASGDYSGDYAVGVVTGQGKGGGSAAVDAAVLAELNLKK